MAHGRPALAVALLVLALVTARGAAAAGIETLIMPGKVTSAHAKIEQECSQCHDRADRDRQATLCLACHKEVAADVREGHGFHGRTPGIRDGQCRACHTEHAGRGADIVKLSTHAFDHERTDFQLAGRHAAAACGSCHRSGRKYREAPTACVECHRNDDPHGGRLGNDCGSCHEPAAWSRTRFDHEKTRYPLRDAHREVACAGCHSGNHYKDVPSACAACHAPDDVHRGSRGTQCADCHTTVAWKTSRFNHAVEAHFPLDGEHGRIPCNACHTTPNIRDPLPKDCLGCHRNDDAHSGRFGTNCDRCHRPDDWRKPQFDHERDGHYRLVGTHAKAACGACHTGVIANQKLGTDCISCHRSDDVHRGKLGTDCARCHSSAAPGWKREISFDHDLTAYPLVGLHVAVPCHACHTTAAYKGAATTCVGCHRDDDRHKGALGPECANCHSPVGWNIWKFDHGKVTAFPLEGAHAKLACAGCHLSPPDQVKLSRDCAACHTRDDVHLGQFGRQCQRCHTTSTFKGARIQ